MNLFESEESEAGSLCVVCRITKTTAICTRCKQPVCNHPGWAQSCLVIHMAEHDPPVHPPDDEENGGLSFKNL